MSLTEKQKRFIDFYIETGNATEAARKAGYASKAAYATGAENLRKPQIKAAIDARLKELEDSRIAKADEVLKFLTATLRSQVTEPHVIVEGTGDGCSEAKVIETGPSVRDRIEAAKNLLKRYPTEMDSKEQKLRLAKLEQELKEAAQDEADDVMIIDDLGDEDDEESTTQ
jgi:phage terminase small subunit|nr:MAG TPA: Terminase small subunit [Caudoviricetes sp.]